MDIERNFFGILSKNFAGVVKTAFYVPKETFWEKYFSCEKSKFSQFFRL